MSLFTLVFTALVNVNNCENFLLAVQAKAKSSVGLHNGLTSNTFVLDIGHQVKGKGFLKKLDLC